jgi:hypothetical protein
VILLAEASSAKALATSGLRRASLSRPAFPRAARVSDADERFCQHSRQPVPAAQFRRRSAAIRRSSIAELTLVHARTLRQEGQLARDLTDPER